MDTTAITSGVTSTADAPATDISKLTTEDFLNLLVTELTHQDPFEPVKNQDLLNQVSSIRSLEMDTDLNDTLAALAETMAEPDEVMQTLMLQSSLNSAGAMIGQIVSGVTEAGEQVAGKVIGVTVDGDKVQFRLDTGRLISAGDVEQVVSDTELAGKLVVAGVSSEDGGYDLVTGKVAEVWVINDEVMLQLEPDQQVRMADVTHIVPSGELIGQPVTGRTLSDTPVSGVVSGVALEGMTVMLELDTGERITMDTMRFVQGEADEV